MKCHQHNDRDAVAQCVDCSKGLCTECSSKYSPPLCQKCLLGRTANMRSSIVKSSIFSALLFVAGFAVGLTMVKDAIYAPLLVGYTYAGIPWGWRALNSITPNIFLILPLVGWLIYFAAKFFLSIFVGFFVTPFKIYEIFKGFSDAKKLEAIGH